MNTPPRTTTPPTFRTARPLPHAVTPAHVDAALFALGLDPATTIAVGIGRPGTYVLVHTLDGWRTIPIVDVVPHPLRVWPTS